MLRNFLLCMKELSYRGDLIGQQLVEQNISEQSSFAQK